MFLKYKSKFLCLVTSQSLQYTFKVDCPNITKSLCVYFCAYRTVKQSHGEVLILHIGIEYKI